MGSYKGLYSYFFANKEVMHFAAHSHHPWPDCTYEAQKKYWQDSVKLLDKKWNYIFSEIAPRLQSFIANEIGVLRPDQIVFAPNTHEFVLRLFSCFKRKKIRILTTDSEFHSFRRQVLRLKEEGFLHLDIVPVNKDLKKNWLKKIKSKKYDMIFTSQIFFNSGLECPDLSLWVPLVPKETMIVIDGYHSFMALPIDLKNFQDRIFFIGGGYKYAQSGEGVCFLYVPPKNKYRPMNTGWFASFETLESQEKKKTHYSDSGFKFAGSTMDFSGVYRLIAVFEMYEGLQLSTPIIHEHVLKLKSHFIKRIKDAHFLDLKFKSIIGDEHKFSPSHFVTFKTSQAKRICESLAQNGILVDHRSDRLRFGFGLYHDLVDVDILVERMKKILECINEDSSRSHDQKSYSSAV